MLGIWIVVDVLKYIAVVMAREKSQKTAEGERVSPSRGVVVAYSSILKARIILDLG